QRERSSPVPAPPSGLERQSSLTAASPERHQIRGSALVANVIIALRSNPIVSTRELASGPISTNRIAGITSGARLLIRVRLSSKGNAIPAATTTDISAKDRK